MKDDSSHSDDDEFLDACCGLVASEITTKAALNGADRNEWLRAICDEVKSLINNDTWVLTEKPKNAKLVGCRTVSRNKCDVDGSLIRRKARIVA